MVLALNMRCIRRIAERGHRVVASTVSDLFTRMHSFEVITVATNGCHGGNAIPSCDSASWIYPWRLFCRFYLLDSAIRAATHPEIRWRGQWGGPDADHWSSRQVGDRLHARATATPACPCRSRLQGNAECGGKGSRRITLCVQWGIIFGVGPAARGFVWIHRSRWRRRSRRYGS